jgi:hypothetical protein
VAWTAACVINATSMGGEPVQPNQIDPYGLLQDTATPKDDGRLPYDPAVLQTIQDSGKLG